VNPNRPGDGEENERKDEFPIGFLPIIKFDEEVDRDKDV
jgi:hypothetical protein